MGSLGSSKGISSQTFIPVQPTTPISTTPINQGNNDVNNQVPTSANTPVNTNVIADLQNMSDDELASVVMASKQAQMPNFLNDVQNPTQQFVYQIGLNEKPQVLDAQAFSQYMAGNGIKNSQIMARSVDGNSYKNDDGTTIKLSADDIVDIMQNSKLNYVGGKHGGMSYGAGTYFDMNGSGSNTGYGSGKTVKAVLDPKKTKAISMNQLQRDASVWASTHTKSARAIGSFTRQNASIYALAMGYNVITSSYSKPYGIVPGEYHNVIDRSVLVYSK